jgi:acetyl esterase/lipase
VPFASGLLLSVALVLAFLTSWTVVPAPNRPLLALGVGAPELSPWLALGGLVVLVLAVGARDRDILARATLVLAAVATVLASVPLMQLPFAVRRFDATMRAALGDDFLRGVSSDRRARLRPAPIIFRDLFLGIDAGQARVSRNIPFAAPQGVRLTLDIYRPVSAGQYPSIVQVYGGAWQRGAPGDDAKFATYLAARGFIVFAIDYRHAPQWPWPAQIEDVRAALAWIREHGGEYGADVSRLALLGRSAGAQLAMVAAYELGAGPIIPVMPIRAVVSYYGPIDLTDGYRNPPRPDPLDVRSIEAAFLEGTPTQIPDRYREASPITYVSPSTSTFAANLRRPRSRRIATIRGDAQRSAARRGCHVGAADNSMGRTCVRRHSKRTKRTAVSLLHRTVSRMGSYAGISSPPAVVRTPV